MDSIDGRRRVVIEASGRRSTAGASRSSASSARRSSSRPTSSPTATTCSSASCATAGGRRRRRGRETPHASRSATTAGAARFAVTALGRCRYTVARLGRPLRDLAARPGQEASRPARTWRSSCSSAPSWSQAASRRADGGRRRAGCARRPRRCAPAAADDAAGAVAWRSTTALAELDGPLRRPALRHRPTGRELGVVVDRERARFGAWYELFPRSAAAEPGRHGTFRDVEAPAAVRRRRWASTSSTCRRSTRSAATHRKGREQRRRPPAPGDPGSPWAIGGRRGRPQGRSTRELGTLDDFRPPRRRGARARHRGRARHRLPVLAGSSLRHASTRSGSATGPTARIQYAENPPKKYQDIYPFDFETRRLAARCGTSCESVVRVLDRAGRAHLPRRQPAHQAVPRSGSG